ncbi:MAG: CoA transferase, partial [Acidimicrobiia bacterium]
GALAHFGNAGGPPVPPINLIGDFGGGGLLLAFGVLAAIIERATSGEGQVIDAAMVDGTAMLMSVFVGLSAMGFWSDDRGTNLLDGGAHFYGVYETSDAKYISIASYEPQFYAALCELLVPLGIPLDPATQMDQSLWADLKTKMAALFTTRTRDGWIDLFAGHDVCFSPVLTMNEARAHPHNIARETFIDVDGAPQPAPAPRFSRTPGAVERAPVVPGTDTDAALADWGLSVAEIEKLKTSGAVA